MKTILAVLSLVVLVSLLIAFPASADPRMETNKNFCHFILDPDNTDNENFLAGCDSVITTVEIPEIVESTESITALTGGHCYIATGYAKRSKKVPPKAAPLAPGTRLVLTSDDSDTPCTMVESNGRAYRSHNWISKITVGKRRKNGLVTVTYEIFCQEGE